MGSQNPYDYHDIDDQELPRRTLSAPFLVGLEFSLLVMITGVMFSLTLSTSSTNGDAYLAIGMVLGGLTFFGLLGTGARWALWAFVALALPALLVGICLHGFDVYAGVLGLQIAFGAPWWIRTLLKARRFRETVSH